MRSSDSESNYYKRSNRRRNRSYSSREPSDTYSGKKRYQKNDESMKDRLIEKVRESKMDRKSKDFLLDKLENMEDNDNEKTKLYDWINMKLRFSIDVCVVPL